MIRHPQNAPEGKIVVADSRGDWVGLGAARLLAAAGHEVTLAVSGYAAGESLQQYVRDRLLAAVSRQRITVLPLVRPYGVDDDTVYLQHVLTEEPVLVEGVAGLVLACGASPAGELLETLEHGGPARDRDRRLPRPPHGGGGRPRRPRGRVRHLTTALTPAPSAGRPVRSRRPTGGGRPR